MIFHTRHNTSQQAFNQESLLHRMTDRIRQSLELEEILEVTVDEVRAFLGTDRVKMYRFDADESGEVIAESIYQQRLPSLLGLHFPADDIPLQAREMFLSTRQRSIVDVVTGRIGLSPLEMIELEFSQKNSDIYYRDVDPCHLKYLKAMGVQSSLVVPILHYNLAERSPTPHLWGLLVSHHSEPRTISPEELRVVQQVADQVAIAIAQSHLLAQTREEKNREATINQITTLLHALPTVQLQKALELTIAAFQGSGGRLYIEQSGEVYTWGDQPIFPPFQDSLIEHHPVWQNWTAQCKSIWAITDLYKETELRVLAPAFQSTRIRGLLVIPLRYHQNFIGILSIFRNEFDTEILWAGSRQYNEQNQLPQISFTAWREKKKGQAPEWKPEDLTLARVLCNHFSMAIQQQLMYQQVQDMCLQVQKLNLNLEFRIQQQTAELQKSLQLTQLLKHITDQIRSTLDYRQILNTIVREVRKLLKTDRVLIYQILDDFSGEVIVEDVDQRCQSILGIKAPAECFPNEYARYYFRGRTRVIHDVSTASLSACHLEFLQNLQIQANLIVPINMGPCLWGLLIAHQCHSPRHWLDDEIEMLQQLANQAAIAIEQAQLYEMSRTAEAKATAKAEQLEHTLHNLQQTQAQLIQNEKMSSLGQLVAGVAHEINNPVNFIYGNLCHATEYTNELLELLSLYQKYYPCSNKEIDSKIESMDLDFLANDFPKIMSSMRVGADRIRSIVLSLKNFSRLDQSERKPVDLHEGIDSTLLILQHRFRGNHDTPGIEIIKNYGHLPQVECYAGQINQVFLHLLNNAIDAVMEGVGRKSDQEIKHFFTCCPDFPLSSSSSPTIRISTEVLAGGTWVLIRIADNGLGITEAVKQRIFDPFFTTKPVGKGVGLGLAISYQIIVEKHGGRIKCFSEPGFGTEFWVEIPVRLESDC
ncbi:MAG: GAF domain-containing protein [Scytonema sp. PMC 1069.18]|nr:GAF domain-containing protein [Scytonema sp. PMC 1069.18]MEC4882622.1 GAF domain-containing protein [Scytonema sp. PMC 1070.18]